MRSPAIQDQAKHASPRAIGIVRVSEVGGRKEERFSSPKDQLRDIEAECERHELELISVINELDISGGKPLPQRPFGLQIERIERGEAEAVVFAYRDRADRSIVSGSEAIERIEAVGGLLIAGGSILSHKTADKWAEATMGSFMAEWQRRQIKEKSAKGQARAVARGATPWSRVPLGYNRKDDGTLKPDPKEVPIARRVFEMRAEGESMTAIRQMLKSHGIKRSHRGVQVMLASRVYLGEIHFGNLVNLHAHEPIIDRELFHRVQKMVIPRGRQPRSDRLLSRLDVLRCGSCGARLSPMKLPKQNDYPIYRCPSTSDCPHHVTISAVMVEQFVTDAVKEALADAEGRASMAQNAQEAISRLKSTQETYDAFTEVFDPLEPADVKRRAELKRVRDEAQERVTHLGPTRTDITISAAEDWDTLSLDARRDLISATVESVTVAAGRGAGRTGKDRITIKLLGH